MDERKAAVNMIASQVLNETRKNLKTKEKNNKSMALLVKKIIDREAKRVSGVN